MSKIVPETLYGRREPQWLLESPKEQQSHFDQRGCVRQIKSSSHARTTTRPSENDLPASKSSSRGRSSYFPQQPSVAADREAVVYSCVPAVTHRTPSNTHFDVPVVEFMVPLCCGKCEEKVKEELESDEGVYKVVCDLHNQRVTVSSDRHPTWLLKRLKQIKKSSHFWRGSTHFKNAHYLASSFPSPKSVPPHHSRVPSLQVQIPAYQESQPPHLRTASRSPNQRYVSHTSPYYNDEEDEIEYQTRNTNHNYNYYGEAEYQYKIPSPYKTSYDMQIYDAVDDTPFSHSLHHGHLPFSYDHPYAMEDYALHLNAYY